MLHNLVQLGVPPWLPLPGLSTNRPPERSVCFCFTQFKEISGAYDVLSDPEKRQLYDEYGEEALKEGGGRPQANPFDIFESFFGGGGGGSRRGTNQSTVFVGGDHAEAGMTFTSILTHTALLQGEEVLGRAKM